MCCLYVVQCLLPSSFVCVTVDVPHVLTVCWTMPSRHLLLSVLLWMFPHVLSVCCTMPSRHLLLSVLLWMFPHVLAVRQRLCESTCCHTFRLHGPPTSICVAVTFIMSNSFFATPMFLYLVFIFSAFSFCMDVCSVLSF